ncbi:profilin-like [Symsagittifera roscoffensis]|uniref:profilin-like n=1 Tax=Symsagittifera roscoffensis TaxID=84072 RepID=UPI00307B196D
MSWDSYIDNLIGQSADANGEHHADKACIIGIDGSMWTSDGHPHSLKLSAEEAAAIGACFSSKNFTSFMSSGVFLEGIKYQFLREEDGKCVFAKKKEHGALTMQASKTAITIAHTGEGKQQGNSNKAVSVIAEYLESMNM